MNSKSNFRIAIVLAFFVVVLFLFVGRLYKVQISKTEETVNSNENYVFRSVVTACRGNILDCNGKMLVSNRAAYNLTINSFIVYSQENTNENIVKLIDKCNELNVEYTDHFPISQEAPFTMIYDQLDSIWQERFKTFMSERDLDVDISAAGLLKQLRKSYSIPDEWGDEKARAVIGVRYELELRSYDYSLSTYVFCSDVASDTLAALSELNIPGVDVEITTLREYNTTYGAHILGSVGKMTASEYEEYKDKGYAMDAIVGKEGFELAFEEYLHGTDGIKYTEISPDGTVVDEYYATEPSSGCNVEVSIDLDMQKIAEDTLEEYILLTRKNGLITASESTGTGRDCEGGAVVVMNVKTGEVLACASYPTYNLATYNEDFEDLLEEDYNPIYNRALLATYSPGSTYKPITALTAMEYIGTDPEEEIDDKGIYTEYASAGYTPMCMLYKNSGVAHHNLNMMRAIRVSCNYYFYALADKIYNTYGSMDPFDKVASAFGLGEHTGGELLESVGTRANGETKKKLYSSEQEQTFYVADAIQAGIGQSDNKFTILQICSYCCALANKGVRLKATFLQRAIKSDYSSIELESQPEVLSTYTATEEAWNAIQTGMRQVVSDNQEGTGRYYLNDCEIPVCAKTGTAEHDSGGSSHACFMCYAPMDDPEIAMAIYVEKGASGGALSYIARKIIDYYFSLETESIGGDEFILSEGHPQ